MRDTVTFTDLSTEVEEMLRVTYAPTEAGACMRNQLERLRGQLTAVKGTLESALDKCARRSEKGPERFMVESAISELGAILV